MTSSKTLTLSDISKWNGTELRQAAQETHRVWVIEALQDNATAVKTAAQKTKATEEAVQALLDHHRSWQNISTKA